MKLQRTLERDNFSAGEIAPRLRTRRDLAKQQSGVARLENMVAVLEGVATRRPGTEFVLPLHDETHLGKQVPFRFSNDDSYNIVLNGERARFFKNGGYIQNEDGSPYEIVTPFYEADLAVLRWAPSGNVLFFANGVDKKPQVLTRIGNVNWTITPYNPEPEPLDPQNLDTTKTVKTNFTFGSGTITASEAGILTANDIGTVWRLDEHDLDEVPQWTANETGLTLNEERRWLGNIYRVTTVGDGTAGPNAPTHEKGTVQAGKGKVKWQWRHKGYGFVRIESQVSPTVFNCHRAGASTVGVALPESVQTAGTYRYWPSAWSDGKGWPDNVRIHQNRLVWFRRDQFWMTESDDFYSFEITPNNLSIPTDASAIPGRLLSPDGSLVENQWALASGVLVIGARDGEWILRAPNSADAVTITNIRATPDGTEGSASHVPTLADGGVAYIGRSRRRLHYIDFDRLEERLQIDEITISSRHILKGRAAGLVFQRDPERVLWVWCQNGDLIGFTFYPKMSPPFVAAHRHPLQNGAVEDMVCIPGKNGETTDVYLIIRRTIAGATRRYVERLLPFFEPTGDAEEPAATGLNTWFADCSLKLYSEAPIDKVSGLDHLEGETVAVFADGGDRGRTTVIGGSIDLDRPANTVIVGLPIVWRVKMLPFEMDTQSRGPTKGAMKTSHEVVIDVVESAGGTVRVNGGPIEELTYTGTLDYGDPIPLHTGPIVATVTTEPQLELTVEISGQSTLPFTLAAVAPAIGMGGA